MGSYRTYLSLVKLQTLVPEFAVEDLPLDRTASLAPAFAMIYPSLGRTLWWWYIILATELGKDTIVSPKLGRVYSRESPDTHLQEAEWTPGQVYTIWRENFPILHCPGSSPSRLARNQAPCRLINLAHIHSSIHSLP